MLRLVLFLGVLQLGYSQFFPDLFDLENPWILNRPIVNIRQTHHGKCTSTQNGNTQDGVCLSRPECNFSGGTSNGRQSCTLGVCCIYAKGCTQTTNRRISYFEYNGNFNNPGTCQFIVRAENNNICQMRLDFERFNFPQPSRDVINDGSGNIIETGTYKCRQAYFQVQSPNLENIPALCGNNDGQHIYVPVNATLGQRQMILNIVNAQTSNNPVTLNWRVKITQLECPSLVKNQKSYRVWEDSRLIAPAGCLQYHTEPTGRIRSFGFNDNNVATSHYSANLNYAICFQRNQDVCGIDFNIDQLSLPGMSTGTATDCTDASGQDTDYLFVPNGEFRGFDTMGTDPSMATTMLPIVIRKQNRYCGDWLQVGSNIEMRTPGPFYIFFKTDNTAPETPTGTTTTMTTIPEPNTNENGWALTYNFVPGINC